MPVPPREPLDLVDQHHGLRLRGFPEVARLQGEEPGVPPERRECRGAGPLVVRRGDAAVDVEPPR